MLPNINGDFIYGLIIGLLIGIIIGVITGIVFNKTHKINIEKISGGFFFFIWIGMHLYGFKNNIQVPFIFDVMGASTAGMFLGVKVSDNLVDLILKRKKDGKKDS